MTRLNRARRRHAGPALYEVLTQINLTHGSTLRYADPALARAMWDALRLAEGSGDPPEHPEIRAVASVTPAMVAEAMKAIGTKGLVPYQRDIVEGVLTGAAGV